MKRSKEELKNRVNELIEDNDIAIQLLEDIEDSFESNESSENDYNDLKAKYDELQKKYRERFTEVKTEDKKDEEDKKEEEVDEKEVVDIKEI